MGNAPHPVTICVAICTRDRPASLARCIQAVLNQDVKPAEIIVVDDGELSEGKQSEFAEAAQRHSVTWRYVRKTQPGLTRSRNIALSLSGCDVVQFLDDDAEPMYDFLSEIASLFAADTEGDIAIAGGRLVEPPLTGLGGRFWRHGSAFAGWWALGRRRMRRQGCLDVSLAEHRMVPGIKLGGAALAVRRRLVYPPGFDEALEGYALGEDREICLRLSRHFLVGEASRAWVTHHVDPGHRPDPKRFGFATVYNYCYIQSKNLPMGVGECVQILWSFIVLAAMRLAFCMAGDRRRNVSELWGMVLGGSSWAMRVARQNGFCW